ncbi:DUF3951 domain-containing protein [Heyndrickxia oleronia]|jgi:hypothetical protein|uniref:DUF3951 domain-containing protein n=1 Tax=Heyndrickxia oleronia TaxID=38875 RepID=UPI001F256993|nr:DUF3951 domain-containing protein [Heyndrickxia oleronia]MCI1593247.1 DUF3951 domain-containing protein [Heyndrickxia oleronia]MCI1613560.1 DUF3951 domain-containing protein [Heyndrickxia oleronia]MCI1761442.1 DUF3951 domain-containing protein [Heyndrickxia oleronia]MCM3457072.1 DUF3951 domain-containing protein [Heyndrickxia oleronia]
MIILTSLSILFTVMIVFVLGLIIFKIVKNRMLPNNSYTPFDYITAQSTVEFHEEKEKTIEEVKSGDKDSK